MSKKFDHLAKPIFCHEDVSRSVDWLYELGGFIAELDESHPIKDDMVEELDCLIEANFNKLDLNARLAGMDLTDSDLEGFERASWIAFNLFRHPLKTYKFLRADEQAADQEAVGGEADIYRKKVFGTITLVGMRRVMDDINRGRTLDEIEENVEGFLRDVSLQFESADVQGYLPRPFAGSDHVKAMYTTMCYWVDLSLEHEK